MPTLRVGGRLPPPTGLMPSAFYNIVIGDFGIALRLEHAAYV